MAAEKNFENKIKQYLDDQGIWWIKYWGGAKFTKIGIPDILANIGGCFFAIEIKAEHGKPSILQLKNLDKIHKTGGYAILLYPKDFENFKDFVDGFTYGVGALLNDEQRSWYASNRALQEKWKNKLKKID